MSTMNGNMRDMTTWQKFIYIFRTTVSFVIHYFFLLGKTWESTKCGWDEKIWLHACKILRSIKKLKWKKLNGFMNTLTFAECAYGPVMSWIHLEKIKSMSANNKDLLAFFLVFSVVNDLSQNKINNRIIIKHILFILMGVQSDMFVLIYFLYPDFRFLFKCRCTCFVFLSI